MSVHESPATKCLALKEASAPPRLHLSAHLSIPSWMTPQQPLLIPTSLPFQTLPPSHASFLTWCYQSVSLRRPAQFTAGKTCSWMYLLLNLKLHPAVSKCGSLWTAKGSVASDHVGYSLSWLNHRPDPLLTFRDRQQSKRRAGQAAQICSAHFLLSSRLHQWALGQGGKTDAWIPETSPTYQCGDFAIDVIDAPFNLSAHLSWWARHHTWTHQHLRLDIINGKN